MPPSATWGVRSNAGPSGGAPRPTRSGRPTGSWRTCGCCRRPRSGRRGRRGPAWRYGWPRTPASHGGSRLGRWRRPRCMVARLRGKAALPVCGCSGRRVRLLRHGDPLRRRRRAGGSGGPDRPEGFLMTTDDLLARHRAALPSWQMLYYEEPIEIVSGSGCRVTDAGGRTYLDFFGGVLTTMLGYDVPEVREAVERQLRTGIVHTSTLYLIRSQVELAEKIARLSGIPDARVFFTNSGTEANEAALLVSTNFRRSNQILAVRNSYHGRTYAAMGVTGNRGWSASGLNPLTVSFLHSGDRLRGVFAGLSDADHIAAAVGDLREVLATTTAGDVACLIAEPIQGVGGFVLGPDGLFAAWREVLDEHGILFVSDEVQTGW